MCIRDREWSELANGWFAGEKAVQVDIRQGAAEDERIITCLLYTSRCV